MSKLTVTTIDTRDSSTPLILSTGAGTGQVIIEPSNNDIHLANSQLKVSSNDAGFISLGGELGNFVGNEQDYAQLHIQNINSGTDASVDFIATADSGSDTTDYIDLGINGSGYNNPAFNISGPRDGYLYTSSQNLAIGTANTKHLVFFTGGTSYLNKAAQIDPQNNLTVFGPIVANSFSGYGAGFSNMQLFSTLGTQSWTIPTNVKRFKITAIGAGGSGGGSHQSANVGFGAGSGAVTIGFFDVVPGQQTVFLNVGAAGGIVTTSFVSSGANGNTGWPSNVNYAGTWMFANAGTGGANSWFGGHLPNAAFGLGGASFGGTLNFVGRRGGQGGNVATTIIGSPIAAAMGLGSDTPLGYGSGKSFDIPGTAGANGTNATGFGAGGGGGASGIGSATLTRGGAGANGAIIIEW